MANINLKTELVNELAFLVGVQEKIWEYHPNNPNGKDIVEVFNQIQEDIEVIEEQLKQID
jgi:hypothetical protein